MQIYCGLVLSPTEDISSLGKLITSLAYAEDGRDLVKAGFTLQHLHLISERPFQDGDFIWVPNRLSGPNATQILYGEPYIWKYEENVTNMLRHREAKKIEASTAREMPGVLCLGESILKDYFEAKKSPSSELSARLIPDHEQYDIILDVRHFYYSALQ